MSSGNQDHQDDVLKTWSDEDKVAAVQDVTSLATICRIYLDDYCPGHTPADVIAMTQLVLEAWLDRRLESRIKAAK